MLRFSNRVISKLKIQIPVWPGGCWKTGQISFSLKGGRTTHVVRHRVFIVRDTWPSSAQLLPSTPQCLPLTEASIQIFLQCFWDWFSHLLLKMSSYWTLSHGTGGNWSLLLNPGWLDFDCMVGMPRGRLWTFASLTQENSLQLVLGSAPGNGFLGLLFCFSMLDPFLF